MYETLGKLAIYSNGTHKPLNNVPSIHLPGGTAGGISIRLVAGIGLTSSPKEMSAHTKLGK